MKQVMVAEIIAVQKNPINKIPFHHLYNDQKKNV